MGRLPDLLAAAVLLVASVARALGPLPPVGPGAADPVAQRFAAASASLERERSGPAGIADLVTLEGLKEQLPDLGRLARVYERAATDPASHPEVRALARFQLAYLEVSRGNLQRASAHLRGLGFVSGWWVTGPFEDEGKQGFAVAYPPEREIDLAARYPGKEREVGWRALPGDAEAFGFVHLGAMLRPAHEVVAYALAVVVSPRDERVRLWFGASGASRVWVNGVLALQDSTYHAARLDQRAAAVSLQKGANRILVKLCHQNGEMGFYLRLSDDRGEGRSFLAGDPAAAAAAPGPAPTPIEDATILLARRAAAAAGPAAAEAHATLSAVLTVRAAGDPDERRAFAEAAHAAALAPRSVDAQLAAAALEEDRAQRRALFDAALRQSPGDARLLRALAGEELDQNRPQAAALLLERAIASAPGWAEPRVALSEALERSDLAARAALLSDETARLFPTSPAAVRGAAHAAERLGRVDEAMRRERTLLALRFDDWPARASLSAHLLDRRDLAGALALLEEAIRISPSDLGLHLRLADLLAANDRFDEAEKAFARALELCPEEAEVWERRGRARLNQGRVREAKADLSRALALRPQDVSVKELVLSLTPDEERFWKPYQLEARAISSSEPPAAGEDAVVLGELHVTRVLPSGLSSSFTQRIVKVLTQRGADAFRRQQLAWSPDRQEVRVERAVVWKPDGTAMESHNEEVESTSEPWYRLYYDVLARTLSFPALAPGDVLELAWRVDDTASENLLSDYFGDFTYLDEPWRKLRFDYVLLVPESRSIHANEPRGVEHAVRSLPGGVKEHRFTARDLAAVIPEPGMPGWSEVARFLHLSTYGSWDEVNQFYWRLIRDQLRPTPEIRATAQRIAEEVRGRDPVPPRPKAQEEGNSSAASPLFPPPADREARAALVRAAYDFVVTQTRYVGLEFGIHGYKPYRVDQILSRRFGDCKDKASLLHALLEAMGIDSRLVLLRMRHLGRIPDEPASLAVFNHAILYVPELDLWLDGTAAYSGSRDLPGDDRGANVLVVNPDGPPRFGTIPEARPEENRLEAELNFTLSADGSASARGRWRASGVEAPAFRSSYGVEDGRRALLEKSMGQLFPGVRAEWVETSDLSRLEEDVELRFALALPRCAQPDGRGLRFPPFGATTGYVEAYAPLSVRRYDLDLGGPRETHFRDRYELPSGWRVRELPAPVELEGPLGAFALRYREEGGAVVAEGRVLFPVRRISAEAYPAFRALMIEVDRAFGRRVRVEPAGTGGGPT